MITNLNFVRDLLNNQISEYEKRIEQLSPMQDVDYSYEEILWEKIAALQEFKASLINFIAEANKLSEKQSGKT